jgi:cytochrome P450
MALTESLFVGVLVIIFMKLLQIHLKTRINLSAIPHAPMIPSVLYALKNYGKEKMFIFITNVTKQFGSPVKLWYRIDKVFLIVDSPDEIKDIFNAENALQKAFYYKYLHLGKGLFVSEKDLWTKNRKILSRAVNLKMLEVSAPIISEKSEKFVKSLSGKVGEGEFDVMEGVIDCVLDTMFETILGMETDEKLRKHYVDIAER